MTHQMLGISRACLWCATTIIFDGDWKHPDGVTLRQRCSDCAWAGGDQPPGAPCPECGVPRLIDEHYAVPVAEEDRAHIHAGVLAFGLDPSWDPWLREVAHG